MSINLVLVYACVVGQCNMKEMIDKTQLAEEKQEFPAFPYEPYSIQIDFMNALYRFLDKGGVSMLESPTGTLFLLL